MFIAGLDTMLYGDNDNLMCVCVQVTGLINKQVKAIFFYF